MSRLLRSALAATALSCAVLTFGGPSVAQAETASTWALDAINAPAVRTPSSGQGVTVAVIDSGVNAVGSLADNLLPGVTFAGDERLDGAYDDDGHGTSVANMIAGKYGVAPGTSILPIRVVFGEMSAFDLGSAITWAVDQGADIINLSMSADRNASEIEAAVSYAAERDVLLVASAGNRGPTAAPVWPAAYDQVIAVGATNELGQIADFSQWGTHLDLAAPGEDIETMNHNGERVIQSGTSMAAPLVAGAAALLLANYRAASTAQLRTALEGSADDYGAAGFDTTYGHGLLDIDAAELYLGLLLASGRPTATCQPMTCPDTNHQLRVRIDNADLVLSVSGQLLIGGRSRHGELLSDTKGRLVERNAATRNGAHLYAAMTDDGVIRIARRTIERPARPILRATRVARGRWQVVIVDARRVTQQDRCDKSGCWTAVFTTTKVDPKGRMSISRNGKAASVRAARQSFTVTGKARDRIVVRLITADGTSLGSSVTLR